MFRRAVRYRLMFLLAFLLLIIGLTLAVAGEFLVGNFTRMGLVLAIIGGCWCIFISFRQWWRNSAPPPSSSKRS